MISSHRRTSPRFHSHQKEATYLPENTRTIWVSIPSDLYHWSHDPLEIVLEERNPEKAKHKWDKWRPRIQQNQMGDRALYVRLMSMCGGGKHCVYLGDNGIQSSPSLVKRMLPRMEWIQKIRYQDSIRHIHGVCDGIMTVSLASRLCPPIPSLPETTTHVVVYHRPTMKTPHSFVMNGTASMWYVKKWLGEEEEGWEISPDHLLMIGEKGKCWWIVINEKETKAVLEAVWGIRIVRSSALCYDLDSHSLPTWLYPDMKSPSSFWKEEKKKIAERVGEISLLWCCGKTERDRVYRNHGILSWKDPRFRVEMLEWGETPRTEILREIVSVNREDNNDEWIRADKARLYEHLSPFLQDTNLFLDFEYTEDHRIYLIGIMDQKKEQYHAFWSEDLTENGEQELFSRVQDHLCSYGPRVRCWYWYAEKKVLRDRPHPFELDHWSDLWEIARIPVVMRGALDFSLKSIANALSLQGKLPHDYHDLLCKDGEDSLQLAKSVYTKENDDDRQSLEMYNRLDCLVMLVFYKELLAILPNDSI